MCIRNASCLHLLQLPRRAGLSKPGVRHRPEGRDRGLETGAAEGRAGQEVQAEELLVVERQDLHDNVDHRRNARGEEPSQKWDAGHRKRVVRFY